MAKNAKTPDKKKKKEKVDFRSIPKLLRYCKKYWFLVTVCLILSLIGTLATLISPSLIAELTDTMMDGVQNGVDLPRLLQVCLVLAVMYALSATLSYVYSILYASISQKTIRSFRRDISEKLTRLPLRYYDNNKRGEILSRITHDVDSISSALTSNASSILNAFLMFIGVFFLMIKTNVKMTLLAVAMALLSSGMMIGTALLCQKYFVRAKKDNGVMTAQAEEVYKNHQLMRIFHAERQEEERFAEVNQRLYDSNWKATVLSGLLQPISTLISSLGYVLILMLGCSMLLCENPTITYGEITAFLMYTSMFASPFATIAGCFSSLQNTAASASRVFEVLETPEQDPETEKPDVFPPVQGYISLDHVCFGYNEEHRVIDDLCLEMVPGEKIAIVGPSGVGKTTLVNLLMRFYEVDSGEIRIDGISTQSRTREAVRALFDMVLQDTWLFEGTIRENLTFDQDIPTQRLDEVCDALGLSHFISTLPEGYDTLLSRLNGISEGQRQQLTIARMLLKNAPFLIFDEATSALDTRTELLIQNVLKQHMEGKTCFLIAHRLSTIRNADRIIVMDQGRIAEQGSHEELLALGGIYRKMYDLQHAGAWEKA